MTRKLTLEYRSNMYWGTWTGARCLLPFPGIGACFKPSAANRCDSTFFATSAGTRCDEATTSLDCSAGPTQLDWLTALPNLCTGLLRFFSPFTEEELGDDEWWLDGTWRSSSARAVVKTNRKMSVTSVARCTAPMRHHLLPEGIMTDDDDDDVTCRLLRWRFVRAGQRHFSVRSSSTITKSWSISTSPSLVRRAVRNSIAVSSSPETKFNLFCD